MSREKVTEILKKKCDFKGIALPTMDILSSKPEFEELKSEWSNMLAHQLPALPPFEQYWQELPAMFDWLYGRVKKVVPAAMSTLNMPIDESWVLPVMAQAWNLTAPIEIIRFAAANRLCVDLAYDNKHRLIEPYSLRRTKDGNILLYAVKHNTGELRSYRIDRIQGVNVTNILFTPKYTIELTATGFLSAPPVAKKVTIKEPRVIKQYEPRHRSIKRSAYGPRYIFECPLCHKRFTKKIFNAALGKHKDRNGMQCFSGTGVYVDTKFR